MTPQVGLLVTFLSVTALVTVLGAWLFGADAQVSQRLGELSDPHSALLRRRVRGAGRSIRGSIQSLLTSHGLRLLPTAETGHSQLQEQFLSAGMYSPSGPFVYAAVRFVGGLVLPTLILLIGVLGIIDFWDSLFIAGGVGILGMIAPALWLRSRITRRQMFLRTSLPDFLDLMVTCLEAGQSFEAALQRVTSEMRTAHPVLALELTIVQRELALGATPFRVLRNFADRSRLDVVRTLATFVDQAQKFGCSMTESLRTHAEMLRELREQRAEEMAQKAAVKILFPTLLFIFPPILITLAGPAVLEFQQKLRPATQEAAEASEQ
jgi:tight adherence protein C